MIVVFGSVAVGNRCVDLVCGIFVDSVVFVVGVGADLAGGNCGVVVGN